MNSYLLTGATGFLGSEIYQKIKKETLTLGRSPSSDIFFDFGSVVSDFPKVKMVIHCAGKAHSIPKTEDEYKRNLLSFRVFGGKHGHT